MTAEQRVLLEPRHRRSKLSQVIWIDPDRMSGAPCFTGARVPVQMLLEHLKHVS